MATIDFSSEPAYWYEKVIRDSERNGLPVRSRPAVNRDEQLIARDVRRHLDRVTIARGSRAEVAQNTQFTHARTCAFCGQRFSRAEWNAKRLWRVIYPRGGERIEYYRHLICPTTGRS